MSVTTKGACLCEKTTFSITHEEGYKPTTMFCHCKDCQILSGGFGTLNIAFPLDSITWHGDKKSYARAGESGTVNDKVFCGSCGSTMATRAEKRGLIIVKTPCLTDAEAKYDVVPQYEQYVKSKYAFTPATFAQGATQFEEMKK